MQILSGGTISHRLWCGFLFPSGIQVSTIPYISGGILLLQNHKKEKKALFLTFSVLLFQYFFPLTTTLQVSGFPDGLQPSQTLQHWRETLLFLLMWLPQPEVVEQPLDDLHSVAVPPNLLVDPASQSWTLTCWELARSPAAPCQPGAWKRWTLGIGHSSCCFMDLLRGRHGSAQCFKTNFSFRYDNRTVGWAAVAAVPSCNMHIRSGKDPLFILYCETLKCGWLIALTVANFIGVSFCHAPSIAD